VINQIAQRIGSLGLEETGPVLNEMLAFGAVCFARVERATAVNLGGRRMYQRVGSRRNGGE
jgi:hypothetical protein